MEADFARQRKRMVQQQVEGRGVTDPAVLEAMRSVRRECFVPDGAREFAYADAPQPIGSGQTISQPFMVGRMAEAAGLRRGDAVLEVGAGSGYAAAVLAQLGARVVALERNRELADTARRRLHRLGYDVDIVSADGTLGWPEGAPYDAILVAASGPAVPESLKAQLKPGGRLIIPVGYNLHEQRLLRITRGEDGRFLEEDLGAVAFVPLIGAEGWPDGRCGTEPGTVPHDAGVPARVSARIAAFAEPDPDAER